MWWHTNEAWKMNINNYCREISNKIWEICFVEIVIQNNVCFKTLSWQYRLLLLMIIIEKKIEQINMKQKEILSSSNFWMKQIPLFFTIVYLITENEIVENWDHRNFHTKACNHITDFRRSFFSAMRFSAKCVLTECHRFASIFNCLNPNCIQRIKEVAI
jgi:hypothetical protein